MASLTAVGKGFPNFTLHTHPPRPLVLPTPRRYGPLGLDVIILIIVVDNSGFPCNIFKGIHIGQFKRG